MSCINCAAGEYKCQEWVCVRNVPLVATLQKLGPSHVINASPENTLQKRVLLSAPSAWPASMRPVIRCVAKTGPAIQHLLQAVLLIHARVMLDMSLCCLKAQPQCQCLLGAQHVSMGSSSPHAPGLPQTPRTPTLTVKSAMPVQSVCTQHIGTIKTIVQPLCRHNSI